MDSLHEQSGTPVIKNETIKVSNGLQKGSTNIRIIRRAEVLNMIGVSHVTLWRWERDGQFPKRLKLGANSCGWLYSDVIDWIEAKRTVSI